MSEEKRPVLSLKRKPAPDSTPAPGSDATPGVVRRKKVVVVSAPPAWKVKKEKLEQAKKAAEAAARQAVAEPVLPLSHKQVIKCLKSLTRSAGYLSRMREGASRYDLQGNVVSTVTAEEARYASERMMKELLRAERKMSQTI